jgi:hypothetical protein
MSIALNPPELSNAPSEPLWRWSVERYHEMIAKGVLTEEDRVELLDGMLVKKMTKNPPHTVATDLTRRLLESLVPPGWCVRIQDPITLTQSEPEPDLAVVRGTIRDFKQRHPAPVEIGLVVEVADASLSRDRGIKLRLYAEAKLQVYWIVNLIDSQIEVYGEPAASGKTAIYAKPTIFRCNEELTVMIGGKLIGPIRVRDCLP